MSTETGTAPATRTPPGHRDSNEAGDGTLVTPSEKPSRNGQEAEPEAAERTTVLASAGEDVPADPPTVTTEPNGRGSDEEFELGHAAAPPPWQRVRHDAAFARPHPDG